MSFSFPSSFNLFRCTCRARVAITLGAYPFNGRETVLDAIVAAGDLTDRANRHKIVFSRPSGTDDCRHVLPICYNQIAQMGDTSTNYQILPGDRVFVSGMTIWDDVGQTLFPFHLDKCPRCGTREVPCYVANCGNNNCARGNRVMHPHAARSSPKKKARLDH